MARRLTICLLGGLLSVSQAFAHIGSPDIYLDGRAGPYQLFVTVRPPLVIPGVAELEVRSATANVAGMQAVPLPLSEAGAKFAPIPDKLVRSAYDAQLFHGSLWMMAPGSWQVRIAVEGPRGNGSIAIPVPSAAQTTKKMTVGLGAFLTVLGVFLIGGLVAMAGASAREARLDPGTVANSKAVRAGKAAMVVALAIVIAALWGANTWWSAEAASYGDKVYKPLQMRATLQPNQILTLNLTDPGWLSDPRWETLFTRSVDDFVPDHDHLMHLYAIRQPGLDIVYHLHPTLTGPGVFSLSLPDMPAGRYQLYGDVVHENGFPETLVSTFAVPESVKGRQLSGDDASAVGDPVGAGGTRKEFTLQDGYRMKWLTDATELQPHRLTLFRFELVRPDGTKPTDMALYMGMLGHAAFLKTDGTVFAHVHPTGSVSMAAFMLAESQLKRNAESSVPSSDMPGMQMGRVDRTVPAQVASTQDYAGLPNQVSFPYGFPSAGEYRVFVQMKHGQTVETGIFDATVISGPRSSS